MVDGVRRQRFPLARIPVAEASNKPVVNATILLLVTKVFVLASRKKIANATNNRVPVRITIFVVSIDKC